MAQVTFKGEPIEVKGNLPQVGTKAPDFTLVGHDLSDTDLSVVKGKQAVLNIFPSLDTPVCAKSVRKFNETASEHEDVVVLCISADLPFAQTRFCGAEGLDDVITLSAFRNDEFAVDYGVQIADGPLRGLLARAVVVVDADGVVNHAQLVPEIAEEPDYEAVLKAL